MEEKEIIQRPDDNNWKIALALVCAMILGYGLCFSKNTVSNVPFLVGRYFFVALFIWFIFYAAVARKKGASIGGFSFLAIYVCLVLSGLIGYSQQKHEALKMVAELQEQYSAFIESSSDSEGLPRRTEKSINTTPKARGEFGEMERFMKEFMNQMASQRNDYLLEIEAIGWNGILDVNRIEADKTFAESKIIIQRAKEIVEKYKNQTNILLSNARENIRSLNIGESSKTTMLSAFDQEMEKAKKDIDAMWSLEAKTINEFENIITLLSTSKGAWAVEGDQILFYNDSDLVRFYSYIESIQNIMNEQEEMQRQGLQTATRSLDDLKEMK